MDDIVALKALCDAHDGTDGVVHVDQPEAPVLRHYVEGALVGALSVQAGDPPEVGLVVRPDQRRRGIGRALLERASAQLLGGGASELLLTTDARSHSGRAFAIAVGGVYRFSECRLELDRVPEDQIWPIPLSLRRARPHDADTFVGVRAAAFGQSLSETRRRQVEAELCEGHHRYFLAEQDGRAVGTVRIFHHEGSAHVTSFAVLPELQGRGLGRQILTRIVRELAAEGRSPILIEVETENRRALGLYRACGFREIAAYDYYARALGELAE